MSILFCIFVVEKETIKPYNSYNYGNNNSTTEQIR